MDKVSMKFSLHDMRLMAGLINAFGDGPAQGELISIMRSVTDSVGIKLRRRLAEPKRTFPMTLAVHEAMVLRRLVLSGQEFMPVYSDQLLVLSVYFDQSLARYLTAPQP